MKNLHIEFAERKPTACTPQAAKASTVGGPSMGAGLGGASSFSVTGSLMDYCQFLDAVHKGYQVQRERLTRDMNAIAGDPRKLNEMRGLVLRSKQLAKQQAELSAAANLLEQYLLCLF